MTSPPAPSPSYTPPSWLHCAEGASPTDPVGCQGIQVTGHTRCLAHLDPADRITYLASLSSGDDVDHRGTTFDGTLLPALLDALRDPATAHPHFGIARFHGATFSAEATFDNVTFSAAADFNRATFSADTRFGRATFSADAGFNRATFSADTRFDRATFSGFTGFHSTTFSAHAEFGGATFFADAWFDNATFSSTARFHGATFSADAGFSRATFSADTRFGRVAFFADTRFDKATFSADAWFSLATFSATAQFNNATFSADAWFDNATFCAHTGFDNATFSADARFDNATFSADAGFDGVRFHSAAMLGPFVCVGELGLSQAVFGVPVVIEAAATRVRCERTRWDATAILRLRHADLDLTEVVVTQPIAVTAHPTVFPWGPDVVDESALPGTTPGVRVASLRGVDAAHLVLTDIDLSECVFTGAFHLDQLRLEGRTIFRNTPAGIHRQGVLPLRWTRRRVLAEEHHWRAAQTPHVHPTALTDRDWTPGPHHPDPALTPGPDDLAPVYRALRKAFEDGKNEPGAADFYYAEMEMRRHDRHDTTRAERGLLTAYWALSGYGLRASRALTWLGLAMTTTILAMMLWGLPNTDPKPQITGKQAAVGQDMQLTLDNPDPALTGQPLTRLTGKRAEKATRVVLNSVVFRSSGQNLTTTGAYIEMTSRFLEPVLLALAVLAIRSRVKR
ncbi:pentapeptide repeat-containing protein [Embleya sp. NPDC005575]|uniref:pentapeptide repeat-containing protein n=1 Tax=Embleya sp. NPDC005575 TaxID=3156892 RepID=UPI0033BCF092